MDLRNLNTFIQVAELSSFTRAAERLGCSQPTVSLQIRQLEQEMGAPLFDRIGHTVSLTDAGHEALAYAQRICQLSREMVTGAGRDETPGGLVRLAMADSLSAQLIDRSFASLREKLPGVSLHISTGGTDDLFGKLDHNDVDIVCTLDHHIYNSTYIIAHEERIGAHFIISTANPLARKKEVRLPELLALPFMTTERNMSYSRMLVEKLASMSIELHPVLETGSADAVCRLVANNMGASFLPDYVTEEAVRAGRVRRIRIPKFEMDLWKQLLYHRDKWVSRPMRAVLDHLSAVLLQDDLPL